MLAIRSAATAALAVAALFASGAAVAGTPPSSPSPSSSPSSAAAAPAAAEELRRFVKDGVAVEFTLERASPGEPGGGPLREGEHAVARLRLTDVSSGAPVQGLSPSAWIDLRNGAAPATEKECKSKIAQYLQGSVGVRPLVDLNSYFVLVLNRDSTISVIDPVVGMTGRTNLFTTVILPRPGGDWVQTPDRRRLFVSMPAAGQVAVIDAERFKLVSSVAAGERPLRVAMHRDGRYLWVANDARGAASGVTALDATTLAVAGHVATGRGHHELALSLDDRRVFVTNRESGTVSVVDSASRRKVADVATGPLPIALAASALSQAIYVADGKDGSIAAIDPDRLVITARMPASPGLGPLRFSQDGRWGFAVNPAEHAVFVVDASENRIVHRIAVEGEPYQVTFTRAFAYVRLLDSPRVQMVNLLSLGEGKTPTVQSFGAGTQPPRDAGDLSIADAISPASTEAAVFALNPADNNTYFYMEGMNAPMGSYGGYGHAGRAVSVVDRTLREVEPGVYAAPLRIPAAGAFDVAVLLDNPRVAHCFGAEAEPDPALAPASQRAQVSFAALPERATAGERVKVELAVTDAVTQRGRAGLKDLRVLYHAIPGGPRRQAIATEVGEGRYAAALDLASAGTWYVFVSSPSAGISGRDMPFRSIAVEKPSANPVANASASAAVSAPPSSPAQEQP